MIHRKRKSTYSSVYQPAFCRVHQVPHYPRSRPSLPTRAHRSRIGVGSPLSVRRPRASSSLSNWPTPPRLTLWIQFSPRRWNQSLSRRRAVPHRFRRLKLTAAALFRWRARRHRWECKRGERCRGLLGEGLEAVVRRKRRGEDFCPWGGD